MTARATVSLRNPLLLRLIVCLFSAALATVLENAGFAHTAILGAVAAVWIAIGALRAILLHRRAEAAAQKAMAADA